MQYYYTVMDYAENSTRYPINSHYSMRINPLFTHVGIVIVGVGAAGLMAVLIVASSVKQWRAWKQYNRINGGRLPEINYE